MDVHIHVAFEDNDDYQFTVERESSVSTSIIVDCAIITSDQLYESAILLLANYDTWFVPCVITRVAVSPG